VGIESDIKRQLGIILEVRETAGYGWTLRDSKGYEINCGSGSLGKNQTAYDAEVAAIGEGIKAVAKSQQAFKHLSIFSDSTSAMNNIQQRPRLNSVRKANTPSLHRLLRRAL
jgi:ribonuclease HI